MQLDPYARPQQCNMLIKKYKYIIHDNNLSLAARTLLLKLIDLPETSELNFNDLYLYERNERNRQDLVRAFISLRNWGYINSEIDIDEKKGPLYEPRRVPLVKILTQYAKRIH